MSKNSPGDVIANLPEYPFGIRLGGAGPEYLGTGEPDGSDAVVLVSVGGSAQLEDDVGPWRGTIGRRGVRDGGGRAADGVPESVVEGLEEARGDQAIGWQWVGELDVFLGRRVLAEGMGD